MSYRIFTESSSSLPLNLIKELNIGLVSIPIYLDNVEYRGTEDKEAIDMKYFYSQMKNKVKTNTSCCNESDYISAFTKTLEDGLDILCISFSSALSKTYENCVSASKSLKEKFPKRKIIVIDSLCACLGQGKLVYTACQNQANGMSLEDNAKDIESKKLSLIHLFTVDDLYYLYKGGRIKATSYTIGKLINIKPILHVDDNGKLVAIGKVLSRKKALMTLVDKMAETIVAPENQTIFINHGDCQEDVDFVISKIKEKMKVKDIIVAYCGATIGSHSGPGTLAIFFYGTKR